MKTITEFLVKKHQSEDDYDIDANIKKKVSKNNIELLVKGWLIGYESTNNGTRTLLDWAKVYNWMVKNDNKGFAVNQFPFKKFGISSEKYMKSTLDACTSYNIYNQQGNKYYASPINKWTHEKDT